MAKLKRRARPREDHLPALPQFAHLQVVEFATKDYHAPGAVKESWGWRAVTIGLHYTIEAGTEGLYLGGNNEFGVVAIDRRGETIEVMTHRSRLKAA